MMAGHGAGFAGAEGGPVRHIPVLLEEVAGAVAARPGDLVIDGTFGAGGYSTRILADGASVIGIDRDPNAIRDGHGLVAASGGRLSLWHGAFADMEAAAAGRQADAVMLDIGVSSMQIDEAERGFSFLRDGPLDMRMAQSGTSAADVVNKAKVGDLIRIIGIYGEEKQASRIARMIEKQRAIQPFTSTKQLAAEIEKIMPRRHDDRIHPATRTFQGLRIYVNDELGQLVEALLAAERLLKPGGSLVVVSFHSLEDRIVKRFLADRVDEGHGSRHLPQVELRYPTFSLPFKGAVEAADNELQLNPRARSAKLRAGIRTKAAARSDSSFAGLPDLPPVSAFRSA